ncbi:MAG: AEC family transporter [Pseudanabaenaceae cyanobacterium bins.68]|nr:AEC family transporter [Pseudanabaenaceae cyanobacterium bins.68]
MVEQLGEIYLPLIGWTAIGFLLLRHVPEVFPKLIARSLFWLGVPLQVFGFTLRADLTGAIWLVPMVVSAFLSLSLLLTWWCSWRFRRSDRAPFLLSAVIGNTGFVGLAIAPYLVDQVGLSWVVLFSLTHNIIGSYGFGVAISSYYSQKTQPWHHHLKSVLLTPALWGFGLGLWFKLQQIQLNQPIHQALDLTVNGVTALALILVGIRFSEIKLSKHLQISGLAALCKVLLLPLVLGIILTLFGITDSRRLAVVLEAGMPTAIAGVILAEEYAFSTEIIVVSIALTSLGVLGSIPLWLWLFPAHV